MAVSAPLVVVLALFAASVTLWVDIARGGRLTRRCALTAATALLITGNLIIALGGVLSDAAERVGDWGTQ